MGPGAPPFGTEMALIPGGGGVQADMPGRGGGLCDTDTGSGDEVQLSGQGDTERKHGD